MFPLLAGAGLLIGLVLWATSDVGEKPQAIRTEDFQTSINMAIEAVDNDDLATYRAALAAAGAQLDVSRGPTLKDEQALGTYQSMLATPHNWQLKEILSYAGLLQVQGYDFEAGNLVVLASGLV